ncbi:MAG TPA: mucoidy inhibitor MuiA family protein [Aequorivita sp.]|nr:mucoidy inhibitor MuiA family protein [Aequorivita sp.]
MKTFSQSISPILIILFLVSGLQFTSAQTVLETNASLLDATIYSRGAGLHHTAKQLSIPNGNSELVINQIAQNVNPQSIRVTSESNQITILSVSFERDYLVKGENMSSQYVELKKKYEDAKEILDAMTNARKGEESTLALLEENRKFGGQNGVSPTSLAAMIKYYRAEYKILAANIIELKSTEQEQQKTVDKLKKQMQEAGGSGQNAGQLVVRLNANEAVKTNFDINYFTDNVYWTPFYEIRVDNLNEPVQLVYKANVSQNTGIDWKQIKMAFSSGNPRRNNNAPQLNPWWVGFQREQEVTVEMMLQGKAAGVQIENAVVTAPSNDMAVVEENQLTTSFVVNTPYDVYSNQKPQAVQLKQYQLPAKYSYFTAPRLDDAAFLVAKVSDWAKYNLLPGNANLIIDNNFAGSSYIYPNSTEDTLTLSLGRDERIVTKRERINEEGSTSFFGTSQKRIYTYEISIRNSRKEAVDIDVKEQFPLSTEKDIEIKLLETSNAKVDNDKGELSWNLKLKSGETKKLKISYSVKLPKDKVISGM